MTVGDVVVTTHEHAIVVGDVISGWSWTPSSDGTTNLRRSVEWRNPDTPIDFSDLPAPLPAHLQTGRTLVDLTGDLDLIDALTDSMRDIEIAVSVDPELVVPETRHVQLDEPTPEFASSLLVGHDWLCRLSNC